MLNQIKNELKDLENFYNQSENQNGLVLIRIKKREFITEKEKIVQILKILINQKNIDLDEINYITETMKASTMNSYEICTLDKIQKLTKEYLLEKQFNIGKIKKNPIINDIKYKHLCIINQCSNFDSFKYNQNNFDNMISLLKIVQRLKCENIKIELKDFKYKTEDTNNTTENYKNKILEEGLKGFSLMKFII